MYNFIKINSTVLDSIVDIFMESVILYLVNILQFYISQGVIDMNFQYPYEAWNGFGPGTWIKEINVRNFIKHNYTPYDGDEQFLVGPTQNTLDLWDQVMDLTRQEREAGGVLDMDTHIISTITSHGPGYQD